MKLLFKVIMFLIIFSSLIIAVYYYAMYIGAKGLNIYEYKIENKKINEKYDGLKIVHLSDIHYGFGITEKELLNIVNKVNLTKPDICVITGDLINNYINDDQYKELVAVLSKIEVNIGKYIIDGNHDHKYNKWEDLINESGFVNLNDSYDDIYNNTSESIFIAGVSNNTYSEKNIKDKTELIFDYMNNQEFKSKFNILLMHEPDFVDDIDYNKFDLILAGHSHNGQVRLPFIGAFYTPENAKKYYKPYYNLSGTDFYISAGIGTSELPVRLFNKPSFNLYRIVKKQD